MSYSFIRLRCAVPQQLKPLAEPQALFFRGKAQRDLAQPRAIAHGSRIQIANRDGKDALRHGGK